MQSGRNLTGREIYLNNEIFLTSREKEKKKAALFQCSTFFKKNISAPPLNVHKTHSRCKFQWHVSYLVSRWTQSFMRWLNSYLYGHICAIWKSEAYLAVFQVTDRYHKGYAKAYVFSWNSKSRPSRKASSSHIH